MDKWKGKEERRKVTERKSGMDINMSNSLEAKRHKDLSKSSGRYDSIQGYQIFSNVWDLSWTMATRFSLVIFFLCVGNFEGPFVSVYWLYINIYLVLNVDFQN